MWINYASYYSVKQINANLASSFTFEKPQDAETNGKRK